MSKFPTLFSRGEYSNPVRAMSRMQRQMDKMFDEFLSGGSSFDFPGTSEGVFQPLFDVRQTNSHYLVSFDLPGLSKDHVKIEVEDGVLKVSGERKEEHEDKKGTSIRTERYFGAFEKVVPLPSNIQAEEIEAQFENGVLHIAIPKGETAQSKKIEIKEGKPGFFSRLLGKSEEKAA